LLPLAIPCKQHQHSCAADKQCKAEEPANYTASNGPCLGFLASAGDGVGTNVPGLAFTILAVFTTVTVLALVNEPVPTDYEWR
jgi:hypothetical protein